jgi:hypothetical protein
MTDIARTLSALFRALVARWPAKRPLPPTRHPRRVRFTDPAG